MRSHLQRFELLGSKPCSERLAAELALLHLLLPLHLHLLLPPLLPHGLQLCEEVAQLDGGVPTESSIADVVFEQVRRQS